MKRIGTLSLFLAFLLPFTVSCGITSTVESSFEEISAREAKEIMDTQKDCIVLDVRTAEEYAQGHIKGAILLDHSDIDTKAHVVLPEKNALILVYCRSGRRSKIASERLVKLGYTNVKEFGGIIDWPYDVVVD